MKTYVACDVPEPEADNIRQVLERLESDGHFVADVRHEQTAHVWRVFAQDRRSREVLTINRRRETD
jgi:hypothetical protein